MKEKYIKPQADVEEFKTVDVITTSGNPEDDNSAHFPFG